MELTKVVVLNDQMIRLDEIANIGDTINLQKLKVLDDTFIRKLIEEGKDKVYEEKINEKINALTSSHTKDLKLLNEKNSHDLDQVKNELNHQKDAVVAELNSKIKELEAKAKEQERNFNFIKESFSKEKELAIEKSNKEIEEKFSKELQDLKETNASLNEKLKSVETQAITSTKLNDQVEINKLKEDLLLKERMISELKLQKNVLGVKPLGEQLENWCINEYRQYATSGFHNCTFIKDNELVQFDDSDKKTKADYIFKSYFDKEKTLEITSICCDMKSENPDSKTKKHNSDFFKKLNDDRLKKKCKYALLVSELDFNADNDVPMYKVTEYEDMYVVRPQYLMSFIDIVYSIGEVYHEMEEELAKNKIIFKDKLALEKEFLDMKKTYLDNPIVRITGYVDKIKKNTVDIQKANNNTMTICNDLIDQVLVDTKAKIEKFNIRKIMNKLSEINEQEALSTDEAIETNSGSEETLDSTNDAAELLK